MKETSKDDVRIEVSVKASTYDEVFYIANAFHNTLVGNDDYVDSNIILNVCKPEDEEHQLTLTIFENCSTFPGVSIPGFMRSVERKYRRYSDLVKMNGEGKLENMELSDITEAKQRYAKLLAYHGTKYNTTFTHNDVKKLLDHYDKIAQKADLMMVFDYDENKWVVDEKCMYDDAASDAYIDFIH